MTRIARHDQDWWTAAEIADAGLPDMPTSRQGVEKIIQRQGWRTQPKLARKRAGRIGGGGWEYSIKLFPARAQRHLTELAMGKDAAVPKPPKTALYPLRRPAHVPPPRAPHRNRAGERR